MSWLASAILIYTVVMVLIFLVAARQHKIMMKDKRDQENRFYDILTKLSTDTLRKELENPEHGWFEINEIRKELNRRS